METRVTSERFMSTRNVVKKNARREWNHAWRMRVLRIIPDAL